MEAIASTETNTSRAAAAAQAANRGPVRSASRTESSARRVRGDRLPSRRRAAGLRPSSPWPAARLRGSRRPTTNVPAKRSAARSTGVASDVRDRDLGGRKNRPGRRRVARRPRHRWHALARATPTAVSSLSRATTGANRGFQGCRDSEDPGAAAQVDNARRPEALLLQLEAEPVVAAPGSNARPGRRRRRRHRRPVPPRGTDPQRADSDGPVKTAPLVLPTDHHLQRSPARAPPGVASRRRDPYRRPARAFRRPRAPRTPRKARSIIKYRASSAKSAGTVTARRRSVVSGTPSAAVRRSRRPAGSCARARCGRTPRGASGCCP